jgi:hypothetical protein
MALPVAAASAAAVRAACLVCSLAFACVLGPCFIVSAVANPGGGAADRTPHHPAPTPSAGGVPGGRRRGRQRRQARRWCGPHCCLCSELPLIVGALPGCCGRCPILPPLRKSLLIGERRLAGNRCLSADRVALLRLSPRMSARVVGMRAAEENAKKPSMLTVDGTSLQFEPAVCLRALRLHLPVQLVVHLRVRRRRFVSGAGSFYTCDSCAYLRVCCVPVLIDHDKYRSSARGSRTSLFISSSGLISTPRAAHPGFRRDIVYAGQSGACFPLFFGGANRLHPPPRGSSG